MPIRPALLLFLALAASIPPTVCADSAVFDAFHYAGRDSVFEDTLKPGHYRNPVLAGFHPDPSITRVGSDYYLVTSSFAWWPGLPVFHSRDLVNWRRIGHALNRREQLTFENGQGISRGIFAPTIRHHDGRFWIITTDVDGIGNFFITAEDPAGPWSEPVPLPQIDGIDPDLFFDDDGRAWLAHNGPPAGEPLYEGHRAIWLWEFDAERGAVVDGSGRIVVDGGVDITQQPVWIEAPHLYKVDGWYILSCAEGGTGENHSQVVFRTRDLSEPFEPYAKNPILTQRDLDPGRPHPVTSTGHADFVQTLAGDWWAVFLGVRPWDQRHHNTGRETFLLPVSWRDGWPHILPAGATVPAQAPRPALQTMDAGIPAQTGNFTWRDEFDAPQLDLEWLRVRTDPEDWVTLRPAAGQIELQALPRTLSTRAQPALLARRQQHQRFEATVRLLLPLDPGVSAGIAGFQSSDHHYFLGVRATESGYEAFVEATRGGATTVLARREFGGSPRDIELTLAQRGATIDFHLTPAGAEPLALLRGADAALLSTQVAGGFVGAMLGIHARSETP